MKSELSTERINYLTNSSKDGNTTVVLKASKRGWGPCMWVTAAVLFVAIILLVVSILTFFTVQGFNVSPSEVEALAFSRGREPHNDTVSANFVLTASTTQHPKICVLETEILASPATGSFRRERIPNSRPFNIHAISLSDQSSTTSLAHPLKFQNYTRSLGIDGDCHVIVYYRGDTPESIHAATFVWWLFKLYGHRRVSVMEGGLAEWKQRGFKLKKKTPMRLKTGNMEAKWDPRWLITFEDVLLGVTRNKFSTVDSRGVAKFAGLEMHPRARKAGHIRGAVNLPAKNFLTAQNRLKSIPEIKRILELHQLRSRDLHVIYSDSGLSASTVLFAFTLSDFRATLYHGGWIQWSQSRLFDS